MKQQTKKYAYLGIFLFYSILPQFTTAQTDSLKYSIVVHFKYGSRPAKGHKDIEENWFGGMHGGHVLLQLDSDIFSFYPSGERFHIFSHRKQKHGMYVLENLSEWAADTATIKFTSIVFPISYSQYKLLQDVKKKYLAERPYDYAFIGMRCAAATYDVLGRAAIVKPLSRFSNICKNFYPKLLRKKLLKVAKKHHYTIIKHDGRKTRIWEDD